MVGRSEDWTGASKVGGGQEVQGHNPNRQGKQGDGKHNHQGHQRDRMSFFGKMGGASGRRTVGRRFHNK